MTYWIVIREKHLCYNTISATRKDCIKEFEKKWCSWEEGKKNGYKVVKCKIEVL
jgi:hypothetical protein